MSRMSSVKFDRADEERLGRMEAAVAALWPRLEGAHSPADVLAAAAARGGHSHVARLMLRLGAQAGDALIAAAGSGQAEMLGLLLGEAAVQDLPPAFLEASLFACCCAGNAACLEALLAHAPAGHLNLCAKDASGSTPLLCAAAAGHGAVVRLLCRGKAAVDQRGPGGVTPLMAAAKGEARPGHVAVVGSLLDAGAALNLQDEQANTALILAASGNRAPLVRLLLARGAATDLQNSQGQTALMAAAAANVNASIVHMLLACGASADIRDRQGRTALQLARSNSATEWALRTPQSSLRDSSSQQQEQLAELVRARHAAMAPRFIPPALSSARATSAGSARGSSDGAPPAECCVCLKNMRDTLLLPCAHLVCCAVCAAKLPPPRQCPTCRAPVQSTILVYQS